MRCDSIMTPDPHRLRDTDTVGHATDILIAHRQLSLPVIDAEGRYVGMFGADELAALIVPRVALAGSVATNLRFIGEDMRPLVDRYRELRDQPVSQVADKNAVALPPQTEVIEAFRMFCRNRAPLAVVDPANRNLLGVAHYWDVMKAIAQGAPA